MDRVLTGPARASGRSSVVTGTEGNVVFCNFRSEPGSAKRGAASLEEILAGIRGAIADINGAAAETLVVSEEASVLEKDSALQLLKALDSVDNVAFQSRILLAGAGNCPDGDPDAKFVAASLWRFVSAGVAVSERLRAIAGERRSWTGAEARVLREIVAHAAELESTAGACISAMHADARDAEAPP